MSIDRHTRSVRGRFAAAAATYDVLATAQAAAAEQLIEFLPADLDPDRILEIGCGTGLLTALLLKKYPYAKMHAIDVADRMVLHAQARFIHEERISWYVSNVIDFKPDEGYDLIVSNSSLHWLKDLEGGLQHIASMLAPFGQFVFAIMLKGTLGELHEARLRAAPHKPPMGHLPEFEEVLQAVEFSGLELKDSIVEDYKSSYRSGGAFLQCLHDQGLTGGEVSRAATPLTRGELVSLMEDYESRYMNEEGHVVATYRVLFVSAEKTA